MPECEVRAFGSRATWTAKDYSDFDLAIVGEGPLEWRTLGRLKEAFEESSLPMRVDVLDWHDISDSFRKVIERDYVVAADGGQEEGPPGWQRVRWLALGSGNAWRCCHNSRLASRSPPGSTVVRFAYLNRSNLLHTGPTVDSVRHFIQYLRFMFTTAPAEEVDAQRLGAISALLCASRLDPLCRD